MHEEELINRLREKEQTAFEYLIVYYKPIIEKFVFQYGVEPKRISDVVKEVFVKVAQKVDRFEQGTLSILIHQIMIHTLKDNDRRQKKVQKVSGINNDSSHYGYYFEKQSHIFNQINLREMNSKYKLPLMFNHFYDKKRDEISTILKINDANLSKRIQQGEKILEEKFEKAAISHEKNLYDNLSEMRYAYERLPEFTSKQEIMIRIDQARKSQKWKKLLPTFGAVIGLFLFALFGLNYIQEQKQLELKAAEEEERTAARESANAVTTIEPEEEKINEIDPEITEHMELAIENFALEIGLEDVSNFPSVQNIRSMMDELKQSPEMFGGVEATKDYIDWMLTIPSTVIEKLESPSIASPSTFLEVLGVSNMYEMEFQSYLDQLVTSIPVDEYDSIVELQDSPENYTGPEEIKRLLQILNEQGYLIDMDPDYNYLTVKLDYEELKAKLVEKGYGEAYLSYVDYTAKQYNHDWSKWQEEGNFLLELELLLLKYEESYSDEFKNHIIMYMENHLNQYLKTYDGSVTVSEHEKEEYYQFLNNHPESIFGEIINSKLKEWEENDWRRTQEYVMITSEIGFLFDEKYKNVKYDDIVERNRWPITPNTGAVYKDFSSSLDSNLLIELNPLETVSLFAYAYDKEDVNTYTPLVTSANTNEEIFDDWLKIRNTSGYGLTEYPSENTAIVYFVDWERNLLTTVELMKENGIWKINQ